MFGIELVSPLSAVVLAGLVSCEPRDMPKIEILSQQTKTRIDHSKSHRQLEQFDITTVSPYASHVHTRVSGLMGGKITVKSDINIAWTQNQLTGKGCYWFDAVTVRIEHNPTIYIARDYPKHSCRYRETLQHEMQHVQIDRAVLEEYAPRFRAAVRQVALKLGTVRSDGTSTPALMRDRMTGAVEKAISAVADEMAEDRRRRQQALDSYSEYERLSNACP